MNIILLDFDSTVSADGLAPLRKETGWLGEWTESVLDRTKIMFSHELIGELTRLSQRDDVEIIWLTDRQELTEDISRITGLPKLDYLHATLDDIYTVEPWWKLPYVKEQWENEENTVIWVDDGIFNDASSREWVQDRDRFLAIDPSPWRGITRDHIREIDNFLSS